MKSNILRRLTTLWESDISMPSYDHDPFISINKILRLMSIDWDISKPAGFPKCSAADDSAHICLNYYAWDQIAS